MTHRQREFSEGFNYYVPHMQNAADLGQLLTQRTNLGAPVVADADGILAAQDIATAGETTTFAATYSVEAMAKFGRNLTVAASGAATSTVTVTGRDYLGQPLKETLTLAGAATVQGVKAFKYIDKVEFGATAATTINLGWGGKLGLPYTTIAVDAEFEDGVEAAPGTLVIGSRTDPQTATSNDPRGLYTPTGTLDGTAIFEIRARFSNYVNASDNGGMHGMPHYAG